MPVEKTGILLKRELGLDHLSSVKISRVALSSYAIHLVFYNSHKPTMPITNFAIRKWPFTAMVFHGTDLYHGSNKIPAMTPPMDIEDFNGKIRGSLFIPVDLSGYRFIDDSNLTKVFEGNLNLFFRGKLNEITFADLRDKGNVSDFTQVWRKDRNRVMGNAAQNTKLVDCVINEKEGTVVFQFLTEATELNGKKPNDNIDSSYRFYTDDKMETDPPSWKLKRNTSKVYELQIKILNFFDWLDTYNGEEVGKKEMREILETSDVQLSSSSPSFNWQGFAYWLTQIDGSIYKQTIKPQRWDKMHGDGEAFLDKHLASLISSIQFFTNQMAQMITSKLKKRGLL